MVTLKQLGNEHGAIMRRLQPLEDVIIALREGEISDK